ncbi:hypothetical protein M9H77_24589 [Catharanthus roseus]|uniref:Uncharacterized protein n=1 Tax=Catharanthus roseus TaxID=4058 RepID=A0ACC0B0D2_CATRO|nr:hypothetical protein M9H77_24589 [Catharanthus roseus]
MIEEEGRKGILLLKLIIKKVQTQLQLSQSRRSEQDGGRKENILLPEDVKEGHFAVLAVNNEKPQRFLVELQFLSNPAFLRLLKRAEEEYGFGQKGVLAVPCQPEELQKILQQKIGKEC